ncbi:hypothetical protein CRUP_003869 [Coryphaenoides rupestris]|nr:hypothetical protein CRUP_003869 [Coryphaenoides rupestris]
MKGLYCRPGHSDADNKFIIQEMSLPANVDSHHIRVQMKACGLSPLDLKLLGDLGIQRDLIPVGREVAGVILQVGSRVSFFQPDDEVVGVQEPLVVRLQEDEESNDGKRLPHKHDVISALGGRGSLGDVTPGAAVRLQEDEESNDGKRLPHKHDVISALGVGGHWVTSHQELQPLVDILKDIMEKMSAGILGPQPEEAVPLQEATIVMEMIQRCQKRSGVVQF